MMEDSDSVDLGYIFWILTLCPYHKYHHSTCSLEIDFLRNTGWGKRWGGGRHGDGSDDNGGSSS